MPYVGKAASNEKNFVSDYKAITYFSDDELGKEYCLIFR
jgi:hypothetical protein